VGKVLVCPAPFVVVLLAFKGAFSRDHTMPDGAGRAALARPPSEAGRPAMASGSGPPKVFISYAWEDEPHPTWVKEFATTLRTKDGLDVTLDRWTAQPGDELPLFMETSVRESRFVLLICTPAYKTKFDARLGGVGYEAKVITGEIVVGLAKRKVIPIHRAGLWKEAAPTIVAGSLYVDLTGDPFSETAAYGDLVETLHGRREITPEIGYGDRVFEGPGAVPAIAVANFSGRDEELRELLGHLRAPGEKAVCVVASGIGGVGKTALARQLVATVAPSLFRDGAAWSRGRVGACLPSLRLA
jgi:hypothetical protein